MENIILSLLLIKSMTVYEIRLFIQQNLNTVCSDSFGSIQSAIKKLLSKECVEVREYVENSTLKKEYSITSEGKKQFNDWIGTPMNLQKVKSMEEGKFFFLGMATKEKRIRSLNGYLASLREELEKFVRIKEFVQENESTLIQSNVKRIQSEEHLLNDLLEVSGEKAIEDTVKNVCKYQIYNLEYALKRLEEDIRFYQRILDEELREA